MENLSPVVVSRDATPRYDPKTRATTLPTETFPLRDIIDGRIKKTKPPILDRIVGYIEDMLKNI